MSTYDVIIVGGGIAGLRVGIELLKKYPRMRCCILEKYDYIGGRIYTFKKNIPGVGYIQWESGAGRIAASHKKVLDLLKQCGLTYIPIHNVSNFINEKEPKMTNNRFSDMINYYFDPFGQLPAKILAKYTLAEILSNVASDQLHRISGFPYYSEVHTLRADLALASFKHEMGSNAFGIVKEGLSSLTDAMLKQFVSSGGEVIMNTLVTKVSTNHDNSITVNCTDQSAKKSVNRKSVNRKSVNRKSVNGKSVVLALHHNALRDIDGIDLPVLRHLTMMPLLRMYAIFPTKNGVSWFSGLNKIVTDSRIRYIIPIDARRGIVMISYTDGADASWWLKQKNVKPIVMAKIRKLFPELIIPDPIFFKQNPWNAGCSYWLPGDYDVEEESNKSLHPMPKSMPNLFMCGESFAVKQCWVESALVQADKLLENAAFHNVIS
jgi:hypothetical protein